MSTTKKIRILLIILSGIFAVPLVFIMGAGLVLQSNLFSLTYVSLLAIWAHYIFDTARMK